MLRSFVLLAALAAAGAAQAQQGPMGREGGGRGPPRQALTACDGKAADAACSFTGPRRAVQGACRNRENRMVCVPGRRAGRGGAMGPGAGAGGRRGYQPKPPYPNALTLGNKLADTGQVTCFDDRRVIACPDRGEAYFGQDAHYRSRPTAFRDNGDGTVIDGVTGLTWQKGHNSLRLSYYDAEHRCEALDLGGRTNWRLPNLKELFSITSFQGSQGSRYFLDSGFFDFALPGSEILQGDRFAATHRVEMMGQTWSSTIYAGRHWDRAGVEAAFFFNFLDGRIKQAPTMGRNTLFYRCVSGAEYGANGFRNNGNGTISDDSTGLMWQQADDGRTRDWPHALSYCESLKLAGSDDWRLPNVKELQSIVDYRRAPTALDAKFFTQRDRDGWFWSSTTHGDNISSAAYVCFGKCISVEGVDVHGAGAQRSDPKTGDPSNWGAMGGQRDQVRIQNYARCVRDAA